MVAVLGRLILFCALGSVSCASAAQLQLDLPPIDRIPSSERMFIASISSASGEAYPGEFAQMERSCGELNSVTVATMNAWYACRAKTLAGARFQIASLHAAPSASSPVVATIFEERRLTEDGALGFAWTVEVTSDPGVAVPWPESEQAFDYGLHLAGVHRKGDWVRLLASIPADGWLRTNDRNAPGDHPLYVYVGPLDGQILYVEALTVEWPDGRKGEVEAGSFLIDNVTDETVEFRDEIPSDFACGERVTDPVPLPPMLRASISQFFRSDGTPRFSEVYTKGC